VQQNLSCIYSITTSGSDEVNMLGGSVHAKKENAEVLGVASKENGLEVNADETSTWSGLEIEMQDEVTI